MVPVIFNPGERSRRTVPVVPQVVPGKKEPGEPSLVVLSDLEQVRVGLEGAVGLVGEDALGKELA